MKLDLKKIEKTDGFKDMLAIAAYHFGDPNSPEKKSAKEWLRGLSEAGKYELADVVSDALTEMAPTVDYPGDSDVTAKIHFGGDSLWVAGDVEGSKIVSLRVGRYTCMRSGNRTSSTTEFLHFEEEPAWGPLVRKLLLKVAEEYA